VRIESTPEWRRVQTAVITSRVRHSQGEMYIGHGRLSVCLFVSLSLGTFPQYCMDPDVTRGNGRGAL